MYVLDKQPSNKMDHYYSNLLPTTMNHFETLSKEVSYHVFRKQENLKEIEGDQKDANNQSHSHSHSHSHSRSLSLNSANLAELLRANEKIRDEMRTSMSEYLQCVGKVSQLFALLVSSFLKQAANYKRPIDINFIELFHFARMDTWDVDNMSDISTDNESDIRSQTGESANNSTNANASDTSSNENNTGAATGAGANNTGNSATNTSEVETNEEEIGFRKQLNKQRLWLIRFGFRILSGLYWWYSIDYLSLNGDDNESDVKENDRKTNMTFFDKYLHQTVTEVLRELQKVGLTVENLLQLQAHVKSYVVSAHLLVCLFVCLFVCTFAAVSVFVIFFFYILAQPFFFVVCLFACLLVCLIYLTKVKQKKIQKSGM